MNTFDWFADIPLPASNRFNVVEVSFKDGARKDYYRNLKHLDLYRGDHVVVEAAQGYDIGEVTLQGELVKLQLKKKKIKDDATTIRNIVRTAEEADVRNLMNLRALERDMTIKARVIVRELDLDMKIGDVEFQGDGKKATFYYTAEDRVDFRELVRRYASAFQVKIEMRQIGPRQEAGRIGGMGSCGRELCCSSWLTDFKSVTTQAARYQNLSINSDKLSGQCGRLKCCLNYELDTYLDALKHIPRKANKLRTAEGTARLRKTDIFNRTMTYEMERTGTQIKLSADDVFKILSMNKNDDQPRNLFDFAVAPEVEKQEDELHEDLVGQVSLKTLEKGKKKSKKKGSKRRGKRRGGDATNRGGDGSSGQKKKRRRGGRRRRGGKGGSGDGQGSGS